MDVERTMEFILELQAKNQERVANLLTAQENAEKRAGISEKRLDRLEKLLAQLGRLGVASRTRLNSRADEHEKWFAKQQAVLDRVDEKLEEATDKLNALIAVVDRWPRNPAA
jgi:hypothetical protein